MQHSLTRNIQALSHAFPHVGETADQLVDELRDACKEKDFDRVSHCVNQLVGLTPDPPSIADNKAGELPISESRLFENFLAELTPKLAAIEVPVRRLTLLKEALDEAVHSDRPEEMTASVLATFVAETKQFDEMESERIGAELGNLVHALPLASNMADVGDHTVKAVNRPTDVEELLVNLNRIVRFSRKLGVIIEQEQRGTESFLADLSNKLQDIHRLLKRTDAALVESGQGHNDMHDIIQQSVFDLRSSVAQSGSLEALREVVNGNLDCLDGELRDYSQKLSARFRKLSSENSEMLKRVTELEDESAQLKQAIEEEKLNARKDRLTGLNNRLSFDLQLASEYARWSRTNSDLSVVFIDIDHFKNINDTHGHKVGDQVLEAVAKLADQSLRQSDFIARYGGEEFVAILPDTSSSDAQLTAEKLRLNVESKKFKYGDQLISVTVSCGVAQCVPGDTVDTLLVAADRALYRAKNTGRNQSACAQR